MTYKSTKIIVDKNKHVVQNLKVYYNDLFNHRNYRR